MPANPWITTPVLAGPLATNSYDFSISDLNAGATYEYRSYFIVDGIVYYGNSLTGATGAPAFSIPNLTTGTAGLPTSSSYVVSNNMVNDNGKLPIQEYGILYTAYDYLGTNDTLVYNSPSMNVLKTSTVGDITTGVTYNNIASGLPASTVTYYRAFAKSAYGIGYGTIFPYSTV